ncbi:MAG: hypothetical protein KTR28_05310 [Micavibrio sp.]|nr:hypothetical protein [Micavibrio sp.]
MRTTGHAHKTSNITSDSAISQLLRKGWQVTIDDEPKKLKSTNQKAIKAIWAKYRGAKVSRSGDSIYLTNGQTEIPIKVKGNLTQVQLEQIEKAAGFKFEKIRDQKI